MKVDEFRKREDEFNKPPGIIGSDEFRKAAVLITLVPKDGEYFFLFEKRVDDIRQGGEVCFPGGLFDEALDKTTEDTVLRETVEELGIEKDKILLKGKHDMLIAPQAGMIIESFVGVLDIKDIDELNIEEDEVSKVFLIPVSYFENNTPEVYKTRLVIEPDYINREGKKVVLLPSKELDLPERYHKPWGKNLFNVYLFNSEPETVWGFTAKLIISFINRLKQNGYK